MERKLLIAAGGATLFLLGGFAIAQFFNLEEEDKRVPASSNAPTVGRATAPSREPIKVPAYEIPDADEKSESEINTLYDSIVSALKENKVKEAVGMISSFDVITKQKIIHRLMQENPAEFARQPSGDDAEPATSSSPVEESLQESPSAEQPNPTEESPDY